MPEFSGDSASMNTTSRNQTLGQHKAIFDSRQSIGVNVTKLPKLYEYQTKANVDSTYLTVNTVEDAKRKKKVFMQGDHNERPLSGKSSMSKITARYTTAFTQMSGGQTNVSYNG